MLGRVAAVAAASLLFAVPSFPQCKYSPARSAPFRASALDLAIEGNDLWVATSYGVALYDRSVDPPQFTARYAVAGLTRVVRARNEIAYAGSGTTIAVVRKTGVVTTVEAGGLVNDMLLAGDFLYVATSNGLVQFSLLNPTAPVKTSATFTTSRPTVSSLAVINSNLFVADGDVSIESFSITNGATPIPVGSVTAPGGVSTVRANNGQLYASAGAFSTYVFSAASGTFTHVGTASFGMMSMAPANGDIVYTGGNDRRLRAVDFTLAGSPVELFRDDLSPTPGTVNRITALATAGNRLYAAAGDMGLLTYDTTSFAAPFPVKGYPAGGSSSVVSLGDKIYVGRDIGGIQEFTQSSTGTLTSARLWDTTRVHTVWDASNNLLLTSSGATATMWGVAGLSATPTAVASTTFRAAPVSAVLVGTIGYAVLADRTLWSADFAQLAPLPRQVMIADFSPSAIARSGNAVVVADVREAGTTQLAYYSTGDLTSTPKTASVAGAAIAGVTLEGSTAAVLTFSGVTLVDFNAGTQATLADSSLLARSVQFRGGSVYLLTDSKLLVWSATTRALTKQFAIPGEAVAVSIAPNSTIADIATGSGVVSVATIAATKVPSAIATINPNAYYRRVAASFDRTYFFDGSRVDIYTNTLQYVATVRGSIFDIAADDNGFYTISSALAATSYSRNGAVRATLTLNEGLDARPLSLRSAGGALWLTIERGCSSFACEKKTLVLDPRATMAQTMSMAGGVTDAVVDGTRAYALTESPTEIRVLNISDPYHPASVVSTAAPASAVSIGYYNSTVYVLGDKLTAYAEATLTPLGDVLGSYVPDPTGIVTSADQRVRIEGGCALVTGRAFSPQLYTVVSPLQWTPATSFSVPSPVRFVATQPGTLHLLTDHSLETWSTSPVLKPGKKLGR